MAARTHTRVLTRDHRQVHLVHASRDPTRPAKEQGVDLVSYEVALASSRTDVVLVTTPPHTHLPLAIQALEAGKDVIVEKPAFLDVAELEIARRCAEQAGQRLLVAENYPYRPLAGRLRAIIADELVGTPLFLLVNAAKQQPATGWRRELGALLEGGIHWVSLMTSLGPAVRTAHVERAGKTVGPDRSSLCSFTYENGMVGTLAYSWEVPSPMRGLRLSHLHGSAGSVTFESNGAFIALRGRRRRVWPVDPRDPGGERAMWRDLLHALRLGRPARYDLEHAARDLAILNGSREFRVPLAHARAAEREGLELPDDS